MSESITNKDNTEAGNCAFPHSRPATSVGRGAYQGDITLFATDMPLNKGKETDGTMIFDRYIGIDYSGAEVPTASLKGLRIYEGDRLTPLSEVPPPKKPPLVLDAPRDR